ncbi:MAG TPA: hypothetical protein VMY41_10490 [Thermohalobaculum sp.]|nr:hypothetical protein [Thermohalobaculum sp.]
MSRSSRLIFGTIATTAIIAGVALLSAWPSYRAIPEGVGVVKLSFSHGGARNCRQLTPTELAKLPPNMRRKEVCDRRRLPVYVEMDLDGHAVYRASLPSSGIAGDGPSRVYQRFQLPAGEHDITIRLRDTARAEGFDYATERRVALAPEQSFAIDFNLVAGGFIFN